MTLWEWVRQAFISRRPPSPEAIEAREIRRRITEQADQITEHLQKYNRARDPFAAFMADLYNRDQLTRVHRGPE